MIVYGILFLLIVVAALYTLGRLILWARNPNRQDISRPLRRLLLVAAAAWATAFFVPFIAEWLGSGADAVIGAAWLISLILGAMLASRSVSGLWAPIAGGALLAGAVWAAAVGIYVMHAAGWQGLSLDDLDAGRAGTARIWIGALFFAPGGFALGFLLGLVSLRLTWPRTPAAQ